MPSDTSADTMRLYYGVLRGLGPERRARIAFDLSDFTRRVCECGIRSRHPDYDDRTVKLAALRLAIGDELFRRAFPGVEARP